MDFYCFNNDWPSYNTILKVQIQDFNNKNSFFYQKTQGQGFKASLTIY